MNKSILIDARMYGLENSGIGRYLINLIDRLTKINSGENFTLLLRKKYYDNLNLPPKWQKVIADFGHYGFREQILLPKLINSLKPDLVHFPHLNTPVFWSGKYVLTVHDLTMQKQKTDATTLPLPLYYIKRLPFLINSTKAVRNASRIIVPSNEVKNDVVNYYKLDNKNIHTIYEGFSVSNILSKPANVNVLLNKYNIKKPYFIYVGNAYPHKNLSPAIKAMVLLNKQLRTPVNLIIGGSRGVFKERLENTIKKNDAASYVKNIGFIEEQDLGFLYKESLGLIYPSLSEGFGLQGLEAMANGTLVLSSNIEVFKEIYGEYAFYFNPKDISSIAATLKFVIELNKDKRDLLIDASRKYIKKYSWQKMAEETLAVYNSIRNKQ